VLILVHFFMPFINLMEPSNTGFKLHQIPGATKLSNEPGRPRVPSFWIPAMSHGLQLVTFAL